MTFQLLVAAMHKNPIELAKEMNLQSVCRAIREQIFRCQQELLQLRMYMIHL